MLPDANIPLQKCPWTTRGVLVLRAFYTLLSTSLLNPREQITFLECARKEQRFEKTNLGTKNI